MWTKNLLLGVVLLGLIAGGRSQQTTPPPDPQPEPDPQPDPQLEPDPEIFGPLIDPVPSCSSPVIQTEPPGPKCDYYMVVPFKLTSGCENKLCTWLKCAVPVTITITMEYYLEKRTIFSKEGVIENFECTDFTVQEVEKQETIYFTYNAVGENVNIIERKSAVIDAMQSACLAQKDKEIHQQGEKIQLRLPCFDAMLNQVVKNFTKITVVNPDGIRVFQELNPTLESGVATFSFTTSDLVRPGYYSFHFEDEKGQVEYASAQVREYDIPRITWKTNCPNTISVLDKTAELTGSAQYVYGKSVAGTVVGRCCRNTPKYGKEANCFRGVEDVCFEFTNELDENGKFTEHLKMDIYKLPFSGLDNYVLCEMTLKEHGTGIQIPSSCSMWITDRLAILELDRVFIGQYYNRIDIPFAATLKDEKGNPLAYKTITVQINGVDVKYATTDADGRAECAIDTSEYNNPNITLTAFYSPPDLCYGDHSSGSYYSYTYRDYPYDEMNLYRLYSLTRSHVRLRSLPGELSCHQTYRVQLDYALTVEGVGKGATTASFNYLILSRNLVADHGVISVDLTLSFKGSTSFELFTNYKVAIEAKILVFMALEKDIIADAVTLNVGPCFKNEVNLTFTEQIVKPGSTVEQKITAHPGSFCAFRGKNSALNLLNAYDEFTAVNVFNRVQSYVYRLNYGGVDYSDPDPPCIDGNKEQFCNGVYVKLTSFGTDGEFYSNFLDFSLLLFSNLLTRRPVLCGEETGSVYPIYYAYDGGPVAFRKNVAFAAAAPGESSSVDSIRSEWSDVFGFFTAVINADGESIVSTQIPENIAEWQSEAFCSSPEAGIGLTLEPAKVIGILEFFVEVSFPPFVTRGEEVIVILTAANYLKKCTQARPEVESSEHHEVTFLDGGGEQCACHEERVTWKAVVKFLSFGKVEIRVKAATSKVSETCDGENDNNHPSYSDTVVLIINVLVEGIPRVAASSHLMTTEDGKAEVDLPVSEPEDLVEGSFRCFINIVGDPIGLSVEHLDTLLSTPSVCCDQIQAEVLSIAFLHKYLEKFGELDEERYKKILNRFSTGYMNMLSCRQYDGGYSRYRYVYTSDIWGTALGLRTNHHLSEFIFVDESVQIQGIESLSRAQDLESGCLTTTTDWTIFQENYDRSIQITAISASILRELSVKHSNAGPLLEGVDKCLHGVDFGAQNTLTQCYLLHAAATAGDWDTWHSHYSILQEKAVYDGATLYWESDNSVRPVVYRYFPGSSGDVLSTSVVLTSMTYYPDPDQDLINQMSSIATWVSSKVTSNGGWYSAQVTSAAIEALTRFGSIINNGEPDAKVSIERDGTEVFDVTIDQTNKFIVQSKELLQCFGEYKFTVQGKGSPLVQMATSYHTEIAVGENSAYDISVEASSENCYGGVARKIDLKISFSFYGASGGPGTTLLTVPLMTGYETDYSFGRQVPGIQESRVHNGKAYFYIDHTDSNPIEFTMPMYQQNQATTFQAVTVVAEEIYTGETGAAKYWYPCNEEPTQSTEE